MCIYIYIQDILGPHLCRKMPIFQEVLEFMRNDVWRVSAIFVSLVIAGLLF